MLTRQLITVADAVTAAINAAEILTDGIVAERSYPEWDELLEDLGALHCDVVPVFPESVSLLNRGRIKTLASVDIGLRKRFEQKDFEPDRSRIKNSAIDPLVMLLESVALLLTGKRLTDDPSIAWTGTTVPMAYSKRHLRENKQYLGIARIEFTITREVP